jgi:hypothetical protein
MFNPVARLCIQLPTGELIRLGSTAQSTKRGNEMYTLGAFVLLAIALGVVMTVVDGILDMLSVSDAVGKIPVIGANLTVAVSIGLIWVLDVSIIQNFTGEMRATWVHIVVDGVLVAGMIPVKNAVVSAIEKGMRA